MHYMIGIKGWFDKYRLVALAVCAFVSTAGAQDIYWLQFADKEASVFSLDNPALLCIECLARRAAYDILLSVLICLYLLPT